MYNVRFGIVVVAVAAAAIVVVFVICHHMRKTQQKFHIVEYDSKQDLNSSKKKMGIW